MIVIKYELSVLVFDRGPTQSICTRLTGSTKAGIGKLVLVVFYGKAGKVWTNKNNRNIVKSQGKSCLYMN